MKFFNPVVKKFLSVTGIIILAISVLLASIAAYFYYHKIYETMDQWIIFKVSDEKYCYAFHTYKPTANLSIAVIDHNEKQALSMTIDGVFPSNITTDWFLLPIKLFEADYDESDPLKSMNGNLIGSAIIENGQLGFVTPITPNQAKDFWKMISKTSILALQYNNDIITFDVKNLKQALVTALECTAVEYSIE